MSQVLKIGISSKLPTANEMNAITNGLNTIVAAVNFAVRKLLLVFYFLFMRVHNFAHVSELNRIKINIIRQLCVVHIIN